jgi:hypothetical protein
MLTLYFRQVPAPEFPESFRPANAAKADLKCGAALRHRADADGRFYQWIRLVETPS